MAAPFALFIVPWPEPHMWPIFAGVFVIHALYKWAVLASYRRGAFTVVYPVMRGTGPLFTVIGAWFLFGETFSGIQWLGVAVLLAGLYGLALYNMARITVARETLIPALWFAVLTGLFVAALHHLRRLWHSRDGRSLHLPRVVLLHRRGCSTRSLPRPSTDGSRTSPRSGRWRFAASSAGS